jgi:hypothetical protein
MAMPFALYSSVLLTLLIGMFSSIAIAAFGCAQIGTCDLAHKWFFFGFPRAMPPALR